MKKEFASRLLKSRFHPPQELRRVLEAPAATRRRSAWPTAMAKDRYVKGVVNGQFVRVKLPGREPPSRLPKLHNPASPPVKPFTQPPTTAAAGEVPTLQEFTQATRAERREFFDEYWDRVKAWIKHNFAVMVLNFGSVCSLVGFTRSDVLELRLLSVTGSLSYVVYFFALPGPRDWAPILWSLTFIAVNGQKIYQILVERKGSVVLNDEQQAIYENYFQPHGLTLKQFEYIIEKARPIRLKKGDVLVREGEQMKDIFLVTSGKTRAHHLGRRLTAVSFTPRKEKDKDLQAAASGAFVGEMAFFERLWQNNSPFGGEAGNEENTKKVTDRPEVPRKAPATERAQYTILALEDDTTVLAWSHADMQALLDRSSDMRAGLTRAMTSAIVGKVVGFTNSKKKTSESSWWNKVSRVLWPWGESHLQDPQQRVEESSSPFKVHVKEKPMYTLSDGKNLAS